MPTAPVIPLRRRKSAIRCIWIRRNFAFGITLSTLLLGALILSFHPVRYTTKTVLTVIRPDLARKVPVPEKIKGQMISILNTDGFLLPLIEKNRYAQRAAFNPALNPQDTIYAHIIDWLTEKKSTPLNIQIAEKIRKDTAITVKNDSKGITLEIAFTSVTPDLALKVADTLADALATHPALAGTAEIRQRAMSPASFSEPDIAGTLRTSGLLGLFSGIALAYLMTLMQTKKQEAAYVW